jgi:transcriptional regulator with XRE-family HTH domain
MKSSLIKAELEDHGKTGLDIAADLEISGTAVYNVINRKQRSRRVAQKVAETIGKTLDEVFPEYLEISA